MSQTYVAGPCQVHVGTGSAGALEFLGWSVDGVAPRIQAMHEDIYSDFSGPSAPDDISYFPGVGITSIQLVRYNESIAQKLLGWLPSNAAGSVAQYDVGSLMIAEGKAIRVLFYSPYASSKAAMNGMLGVMNFPTSYPVGDFSIPLSSRARRLPITFRHVVQWDHVAGTGILFNSSTAGIPSVN